MRGTTIARLLSGGDRRSIGAANRVAAYVLKNPRKFKELVHCMWSHDPIVRMRAADAVEKVSMGNRTLLQPFKRDLLGLLGETTQQELRWHLAQMTPRLDLTIKQRHRAAECLRGYLNDRSSIVKTFALQALADLAQDDVLLRTEVLGLVNANARSGTPAMRARCRKLQKILTRR